jgi:6-phosphogluconolactonase
MRTRFTWIVAILVLVSIGVLLACSTKYSSSTNGLVVVASQGGGPETGTQVGPAMETFSLNLGNGHVSQINNINGPPTQGLPTSVILDPAGAFAYVIIYANPAVPGGGSTGIETFQIASDGKLAPLNSYALTNPVAMAMDSAGKFLFVANGSEGTVSVFSIGSNATLTPAGTTALPIPTGGQNPSASALAVTPTVYPQLYAYCAGFAPPTTENLYVTDAINYEVLNFSVNLSTGALVPNLVSKTVPGLPTGITHDGVTVDPCNRFVYVANGSTNTGNNGNSVSAYRICSTVNMTSQPACPNADFSLNQITCSLPSSLTCAVSPGDNPGPLAVDAFGNFLYVVDTGSGYVSSFKISPATGSLTPLNPPFVSAGVGANSIAIRSDDSWLFVANITAATLSQFAITPGTGELSPQPPISTFNLPSGVAVK